MAANQPLHCEDPASRSADFQTCCIADFQIGSAPDVVRRAGLETGDTADSEVCATVVPQAVSGKVLSPLRFLRYLLFKIFRCGWAALFLVSILSTIGLGCRSPGPMAPVDSSAPGWSARHGQALWKPPGDRPELAGDLLVVTATNGDFLVQFSKIPFPIATAQAEGNRWRIEFGADKKFSGRGKPPPRFVWFQLPVALAGGQLAHGWRFRDESNGLWHLENQRTRERLQGEFFQ